MRSFTRPVLFTILSLHLFSSMIAALPSGTLPLDLGSAETHHLAERQVRNADYGSSGGPPGDPSQPSDQSSNQVSNNSSSSNQARSAKDATLNLISLPSLDPPAALKYSPDAPKFTKKRSKDLKYFKYTSGGSESSNDIQNRAEVDINRNSRNGSFSREPMFLPRVQRRQARVKSDSDSTEVSVSGPSDALYSSLAHVSPGAEKHQEPSEGSSKRRLPETQFESASFEKSDTTCAYCINVEAPQLAPQKREYIQTPSDSLGVNVGDSGTMFPPISPNNEKRQENAGLLNNDAGDFDDTLTSLKEEHVALQLPVI